MSLARRYELLRWASQQQAWIIEDDYDSEYRYQGRPIPALQGLDEVGRVLYLGTFSKVLFPALRLGYLVVPPALVEAFVSARQLAIHHPPLLEQMALAHFMATGEFTRHIRRMRSLYAERGEFLRSSLNQYLGGMLQVHQPIAGLHLIGWLSAHGNDRAISLRADEAGLDLPPLSAYALRESERQGFLLGYAALDTQQLKEGVVQLARVLEANRK
jgi:GntR family transcriptional regulator/MocR family aminotransferase